MRITGQKKKALQYLWRWLRTQAAGPALPERESEKADPAAPSSLPKVPEPDNKQRPPVRAYYYEDHSLTGPNFIRFARIKPSDGWEIAEIGIARNDGKVYIVESRQRSYGIFLGGEDNESASSFERLREETGLDITEENWKELIPEDQKAPERDPVLPKKVPADRCRFEGKKNVAAYCDVTTRRFGASIAYFRKCGDGYRAFYTSNAVTGANFLGMSAMPSEEELDRYLENSGRFNSFDRLLSREETACFYTEFTDRKRDDEKGYNDIYNSTVTNVTVLFDNGTQRTFSGPTRRTSRIDRCIEILARQGVTPEDA